MSDALMVRLDEGTLGAHSDAQDIQKIEAGLFAADAGDFASEQEVARVRAKFAYAD